ncbi:hypothetical protein HGM15179_000072 [Zosterops borbonicus]|uniref:Reverse transcriptase domain-containing protein n=1 Tax=Zosterops borbonicus TaxID=364589 RepID=A0A8K1GY85_9PASS|nr:hypothetical protein HGM15179_000072 [Zosterops borbonicus]
MPTRRGATLDLVFNKLGLVGSVTFKGSLGCGTYEMVEFKILREARTAYNFGADPHGHKAKAHGKKGVTGHSQNGLTKVKSRLTNLVVLYNRVRALMDKGRAMAFIYLDLHKAYDTVPHDMLVSKLKKA